MSKEEALEYAKRYLRLYSGEELGTQHDFNVAEIVSSINGKIPEYFFEYYMNSHHGLADKIARGLPEYPYALTTYKKRIHALILMAEDDRVAYDALAELFNRIILIERLVYIALVKWAGAVLKGEVKPPKKRFASNKSAEERNRIIKWILLGVHHYFPFEITKSSRENKQTCCCDIVSEALVSRGIPLSYEAVKKIYVDTPTEVIESYKSLIEKGEIISPDDFQSPVDAAKYRYLMTLKQRHKRFWSLTLDGRI
ncbi:MAG: hypothetical protein AXA67_02220 [Methylothermaceae bacteria B42]|nr:MAG: hypothetical protein AXA67_02220 [Methylothermaceae bacteria B42]HHJ39302.1 hypothetical protein [Methylothermaceae bacterium]